MPKATNRAGFNNLTGAKNKKMANGFTPPQNPKKNDRWLNPINGVEQFWDGSAWQLVGIANEKTSLRIKTWVGSEAEYAAIVTKDADTIYMCYA
jgi:hypothetical protein